MTRRGAVIGLMALALLAGAARSQQPNRPAAGKPAVKMYATDWCPYCRKAREYFARNGIPYTEIDIEKSQAAQDEYRSIGGRGVPVILVGSERMNGFSEQRLTQALKAAGY